MQSEESLVDPVLRTSRAEKAKRDEQLSNPVKHEKQLSDPVKHEEQSSDPVKHEEQSSDPVKHEERPSDRVKGLFGPPPVLSTEDPKQFEEVFERVIACLKPRDTVELILIRHFVYAVWEIERLTRYGTLSIEHWYRETLQLRAQQEKLQKARKEDLAWKNAQRNSSKPADIAQLVALEDSFFEVLTDTDEIMERRATEFEHNRAFAQGILFQEQLDKLMASRIARRNDALQQLEHYREGLGQLAQKAVNEILEAEFEEIKDQPGGSAAPSLVAPESTLK